MQPTHSYIWPVQHFLSKHIKRRRLTFRYTDLKLYCRKCLFLEFDVSSLGTLLRPTFRPKKYLQTSSLKSSQGRILGCMTMTTTALRSSETRTSPTLPLNSRWLHNAVRKSNLKLKILFLNFMKIISVYQYDCYYWRGKNRIRDNRNTW